MLKSPLTSVLNGSNSPIFFPVPGIADRLEENLRFKQKYLDMSQTTVDQIINSHLKKIKSKKKRKKLQKELILVGIHVRYDFKKYKSKNFCSYQTLIFSLFFFFCKKDSNLK